MADAPSEEAPSDRADPAETGRHGRDFAGSATRPGGVAVIVCQGALNTGTPPSYAITIRLGHDVSHFAPLKRDRIVLEGNDEQG